jgi:hypothetical protein
MRRYDDAEFQFRHRASPRVCRSKRNTRGRLENLGTVAEPSLSSKTLIAESFACVFHYLTLP